MAGSTKERVLMEKPDGFKRAGCDGVLTLFRPRSGALMTVNSLTRGKSAKGGEEAWQIITPI